MTEGALVVAAIVQAFAAIAIAVYTVKLARFTSSYVGEMRRLNDLQSQANSLSRWTLDRQRSESAPMLIATSGGRDTDGSTYVDGVFVVENRGGGTAFDVQLHTSWGVAKFEEPLGVGPRVAARVRIPYEKWERGSDPELKFFSFRDVEGAPYGQDPGGLPEINLDDV